ncbi:MAG: nitrous oxide reductase family maturation protein NosD [Gemmatimonadota bacterium]
MAIDLGGPDVGRPFNPGPWMIMAVAAGGLLFLAYTSPQRGVTEGESRVSAWAEAHYQAGPEGLETPEPADSLTSLPSGPEFRVGPQGDFPTLAQAVEAAPPGAVIRVASGHYREFPLTLSKPVTLVGEGYPVLDGERSHSILLVAADDVTIRGFEIRGAGKSYTRDHAGITVEEHRGCRIEDNRLEENFFGIYLARTRDCVVQRNRIRSDAVRETDSGNGIHLWDVERIHVRDNEVSGHRDGIYLEFAREVVIRNNLSRGNLRYGLHFMFSDDSFYQDNTFLANGAGVAVMYTRNLVMSGNHFLENWGPAVYGLLLKDVQDALVEGNVFRRNTVAVFAEGADRMTFRFNRLEGNGWALRILGSSQDNHFTANNFVENTFDVTTNSRRSPNTFEENHWSAYQGYDLSGDGFGDVPHRPVRLFSFMVEQEPEALILLRSFFVDVLEVAERVLPVLTPEALMDPRPRMKEVTP